MRWAKSNRGRGAGGKRYYRGMRGGFGNTGRWAAAAALGLMLCRPAGAGEPGDALDLSGLAPGRPSAESGKPMLDMAPRPPVAGGDGRCAAPLPCGARLLGSLRKNGAVELQVPALRW